MQKVLSFTDTEEKKKYISKPFDFEAMCLIQEIHVTGKTDSIGRLCGGAVDHLFEGTEATQDVLDRNPVEKMKMCKQVWLWYVAAMTGKNVESPQEPETVTADKETAEN